MFFFLPFATFLRCGFLLIAERRGPSQAQRSAIVFPPAIRGLPPSSGRPFVDVFFQWASIFGAKKPLRVLEKIVTCPKISAGSSFGVNFPKSNRGL